MYQSFECKFIADAAKSGVTHETLQNGAGRVMTEHEARQILGVSEDATWEEITKASILSISFCFPFQLLSSRITFKPSYTTLLQKYDHLFEKKAKVGNFYLQSKAHRAKECSEASHRAKGEGSPTS
ncbi:mitochondrial import inner membrane translocase subunit PAM16 like 2-like [Hibiscus syriacus]|uniref:mitochondrial import inner membrane translocase subunit PAM16 like 2-like n=1 Tax=Hibiscus syriacus TaxID=106335 RepID=UPI00192154C6|nr:mitochondrial import inner membrane translocase subunit PAM16 like 2-like [Hibiscus syriacus]